MRSGVVCGACWGPPGSVTRGDEATTGLRPLRQVGGVSGDGVECVRGAGQPPFFGRGDEATTPSETVAARRSSIGLCMNEERRSLDRCNPGVGRADQVACSATKSN